MLQSSSAVPENTSLARCLDDDEAYTRIERQLRFVRRYWYGVASGPFFLVIVLLFRYFPQSSGRIWDVAVAISRGWAILVAIYGLILVVRALMIHCPRCGWRSGWADRCTSCGFPRHADACPRVE